MEVWFRAHATVVVEHKIVSMLGAATAGTGSRAPSVLDLAHQSTNFPLDSEFRLVILARRFAQARHSAGFANKPLLISLFCCRAHFCVND